MFSPNGNQCFSPFAKIVTVALCIQISIQLASCTSASKPLKTSTLQPTVVLTPTQIPTPTPVPVAEKFIVFVSNRDSQADIYVINGDSSQMLRLSNTPAEESGVQFSPDGLKLAFLAEQDGEKALFVMNIGEGEPQRLTSGYNIRHFDWSPDGKQLVFAARDPKTGVYELPAGGGEPTELVTGTEDYYAPAWSPEGTQIAYLAGDKDLRKIHLISADGGEQETLTSSSYEELYAAVWSPDGKEIAFSGKANKQSDINLINLSDKSILQLTEDTAPDEVIDAAWSPDGQWLLFWSSPGEHGDIYRINVQTREREQLTRDPHDDFYPQWSPDGKQIYFTSYRDSNEEVYLLDLQKKTEQNITNHPAEDLAMGWYPLEPAILMGEYAEQIAVQATPTQSLPPIPQRGQIIYSSDVSGNVELYSISPDGSSNIRLTDNKLYEISTDWSPDCSQGVISAFPEDSVFDEDSNLFITRRDGSNLHQVTYMQFTALAPVWSPDGTKILFLSDDPGETDLYILELTSNKITKFTDNPLGGDMHSVPWQYHPADWSPDGKWIAYTAPGKVDWDIYKASADGKEKSLLSQDPAPDMSPAWSPAGDHIAFIRNLPEGCTDNCAADIFLMNPDGSEISVLVSNPGDDFSPIWSPDGQRLLFLSTRDGNTEIYVINLDGSGLTNLTKDKADDYYPIWSPDGSQIVFTSERDGNPEIYVINSDGTDITRLTDHSGNDYSNAWLCTVAR
jgi:Tol biopolymer transport system component